MVPDDQGGLNPADVGDIVCCVAFAIVSLMVAIRFAGIASFAWSCFGGVLAPLMG
jgi:hypothetical protein